MLGTCYVEQGRKGGYIAQNQKWRSFDCILSLTPLNTMFDCTANDHATYWKGTWVS